MTDERYADPQLRAALGGLLLDEPPAPPVLDDVARGRARQRRRRARLGAVAGVAVVALGVVVLGSSLRPTAPSLPGATGSPSVLPTAAPVPVAPPCRDRDVKLVPAVDPDAVGDVRSLVVEVHARNPQVRCTVVGHPRVAAIGADGEVVPFEVVQGPRGSEGVEPTPTVLVTQTSTPAAVLTVTQGRCDRPPAGPADLAVTLPGETVATLVELPEGLALSSCPSGSADAQTLWVTAFARP